MHLCGHLYLVNFAQHFLVMWILFLQCTNWQDPVYDLMGFFQQIHLWSTLFSWYNLLLCVVVIINRSYSFYTVLQNELTVCVCMCILPYYNNFSYHCSLSNEKKKVDDEVQREEMKVHRHFWCTFYSHSLFAGQGYTLLCQQQGKR